MGWAKYAWKRRITPINIHIILQKEREKLLVAKIKYSILQFDYLSLTSLGGFSTENVLRRCGTCSTFSNSHCTRWRASPLEISSSEHHDRSFFPWYSKPKVTRDWRGWILCFIQSITTASPVIWFCFRSTIRLSRSGIWLSSVAFFFHSCLLIGAPGAIAGRELSWFPM